MIAITLATSIYIFVVSKHSQRRWSAVAIVLALTVIASVVACGGDGSGSGGGGGSHPGTAAGNYTGVTVTVTINGVTQSINKLSETSNSLQFRLDNGLAKLCSWLIKIQSPTLGRFTERGH